MQKAHKTDERTFRISDDRLASAFGVVDDATGRVIGVTIAMMLGDPNSWIMYLTEDSGMTFKPSGWQFREFPFPPTMIQAVDFSTTETDPTRIAELRLVVDKYRAVLDTN